MSAHRFALGDRVKFTGTVTKQHSDSKTLYVEDQLPRCFDREPFGVPYTEGIIIGRRTVTPGEIEAMTEFDGYGNYIPVGRQFIPTLGASRRVWLVAFDLRRKPVMCFDEQLQKAEVAREPGVNVNAEWILEEVDTDFCDASDEQVKAIHSLPLKVVQDALERHLGYDSSIELLDDFRREVIRDLINIVNDARE